jgi:hypothetical protein
MREIKPFGLNNINHVLDLRKITRYYCKLIKGNNKTYIEPQKDFQFYWISFNMGQL